MPQQDYPPGRWRFERSPRPEPSASEPSGSTSRWYDEPRRRGLVPPYAPDPRKQLGRRAGAPSRTADGGSDGSVAGKLDHAQLVALARQKAAELSRPSRLLCSRCGAQTEGTEGAALAARCQFCGSPLVADSHTSRQVAPDAVLPFRLDLDGARKALRGWARWWWWLAPYKLWKAADLVSSRSTYLPLWTFDVHTFSWFQGERGDAYDTRDGEGRLVKRLGWTEVEGTIAVDFTDVPVIGTRHVTHQELARLEPWPLAQAVPYRPNSLGGHQAVRYDCDPDEAFEAGKVELAEGIRAKARAAIGGDDQRVHAVQTSYSDVHTGLMLLPVWICTYPYAGRTCRIMINGVTGEVAGDRPYSRLKIALTIAGAVLLAAGAGFAILSP